MSTITFDQLPAKVENIEDKIDALTALVAKLLPNTTKKRLTLSEACEFLGYAKSTVYTKVSSKEIPFTKIGKKLYFDSEELEKWITDGK